MAPTRFRQAVVAAAVPLLAWGGAILAGENEARDAPPVVARLKLVGGGEIAGPVVDWTDEAVVIEHDGVPRVLSWTDIDVGSVYRLRKQLLAVRRGGTDLLTANDHLTLGQLALQRDHVALAKREFGLAKELDRNLATTCGTAWEAYRRRKQALGANSEPDPFRAGRLPQEAEPIPANLSAVLSGRAELPDGPEAPANVGDGSASDNSHAPVNATTTARRQRIVAYLKQVGELVRRHVGRELVLTETDHFLIYSDWDPRGRARLADWGEDMYAALGARFGLEADRNIWIGKCPVFCFRSRGRFLRFGRIFDGHSTTGALAYTRTAPNGLVHLALFRRNGSEAEMQRFATSLVHEGCHAFLHRYRTGRVVSGWVAEGLCNSMAEQVLGDYSPVGEHADLIARQYVLRGLALDDLFAGDTALPAHHYPVAQSLVDFLMRRDAAAFRSLIDDLKDGVAVADALAKRYALSYDTLVRDWRADVRRRLITGDAVSATPEDRATP